MQLLLFRHGIAEAHGPDGSDTTRRLTDEGVRKTHQAAAGLSQFVEPPDVIYTSPLTRAQQTAQILGEVYGIVPQIVEVLAYGPAKAVIEALSDEDHQRVMLVGHEPTFSEIVERVCTASHAAGFVRMKNAGCACVEMIDGDIAQLLWLATPKMLRAAAK